MKIATGIIGLMIGLLVLVQSCTATTAARFAGREELIQAGSVGVLAAFLTFVAGAFAFGLSGITSPKCGTDLAARPH